MTQRAADYLHRLLSYRSCNGPYLSTPHLRARCCAAAAAAEVSHPGRRVSDRQLRPECAAVESVPVAYGRRGGGTGRDGARRGGAARGGAASREARRGRIGDTDTRVGFLSRGGFGGVHYR